MRFNCSLVSSFLFVSAVLADYHQPPILDHVEKSINSTDLVDNTDWAGALSWPVESVEAVQGIIQVPRASGLVGSAFDIVVAIKGRPPCNKFLLQAGITVNAKTRDSSTRYKAWFQGMGGDITYAPRFAIRIDDQIKVTVDLTNPTTGFVMFENFRTGRHWYWVNIHVTRDIGCQLQNAVWTVQTHPGSDNPTFPSFQPLVAFMEIRTQISGNYRVPDNLQKSNIFQQQQFLTYTLVSGAFVIITHIPP